MKNKKFLSGVILISFLLLQSKESLANYYLCTLTKQTLDQTVPEKILNEFQIYYSPVEGQTEIEILPFAYDSEVSPQVGTWCSQFDRQHTDQMDRYLHCGYFQEEQGKPRKKLQNLYTLWGVLGGFSIYKWDAPSPTGNMVLKLSCDFY